MGHLGIVPSPALACGLLVAAPGGISGLPCQQIPQGALICSVSMQIPERYLQKINPLVAHARSLVEKGESLAALAFIGNLTKDQLIPVVLDDRSDESKDSSAKAISMAAAMLEADFIFQVREAWMLPPKYVARHEAILEEYGSIGASPYGQDVAAFSLETTHGTWIAMASMKAKPPSKKRRTFGPLVFEYMPEVAGRFVGLLPNKINDGGALH